MIDVETLKQKHENFTCLLYTCKKCGRLNASRINVDLYRPIAPQLNKKYVATKKFCCYCNTTLQNKQFIYFTPKFCDRSSAFHYLSKDRLSHY